MPAPAGAMRVPQYPQNGRPLSAGLVQRGHRMVVAGAGRAGDDLRGAGGAAALAAVAPPDATPGLWTVGGVVGSLAMIAAPLWAATWAAEAVIGLPQSMQNREVASFSRPQNEQKVNRHPPRRETHMAREYRTPFGDGPVLGMAVHTYQSTLVLGSQFSVASSRA